MGKTVFFAKFLGVHGHRSVHCAMVNRCAPPFLDLFEILELKFLTRIYLTSPLKNIVNIRNT